ncbi:hypothetical protein HDK64DRAFT_315888 [Phyllosticta capitalensis]
MQLRLLLLALYGFMLGAIITDGVSASPVPRPLVGDVVSSALPGFGVSAVIKKAAEMAPGSRPKPTLTPAQVEALCEERYSWGHHAPGYYRSCIRSHLRPEDRSNAVKTLETRKSKSYEKEIQALVSNSMMAELSEKQQKAIGEAANKKDKAKLITQYVNERIDKALDDLPEETKLEILAEIPNKKEMKAFLEKFPMFKKAAKSFSKSKPASKKCEEGEDKDGDKKCREKNLAAKVAPPTSIGAGTALAAGLYKLNAHFQPMKWFKPQFNPPPGAAEGANWIAAQAMEIQTDTVIKVGGEAKDLAQKVGEASKYTADKATQQFVKSLANVAGTISNAPGEVAEKMSPFFGYSTASLTDTAGRVADGVGEVVTTSTSTLDTIVGAGVDVADTAVGTGIKVSQTLVNTLETVASTAVDTAVDVGKSLTCTFFNLGCPKNSKAKEKEAKEKAERERENKEREEKEAREKREREEKEAREKKEQEEKEAREKKEREEKEARKKKEREEKEAREQKEREEKEREEKLEREIKERVEQQEKENRKRKEEIERRRKEEAERKKRDKKRKEDRYIRELNKDNKSKIDPIKDIEFPKEQIKKLNKMWQKNSNAELKDLTHQFFDDQGFLNIEEYRENWLKELRKGDGFKDAPPKKLPKNAKPSQGDLYKTSIRDQTIKELKKAGIAREVLHEVEMMRLEGFKQWYGEAEKYLSEAKKLEQLGRDVSPSSIREGLPISLTGHKRAVEMLLKEGKWLAMSEQYAWLPEGEKWKKLLRRVARQINGKTKWEWGR